MKYVGFIKENTNIKDAISFDDMVKHQIVYEEGILKKIKTYLSMGEYVFGWMGYSTDVKTKTPIAPDAYSTDGVWVWPDYFYYYIETYSMAIDHNFFSHMSEANFVFKPDNALLSSMSKIEMELHIKLKDPFR